MERLGGRTHHRVRFLAAGAGTVWHMTGWEEDGERRWGRSVHGVVWVRAIGGVAVACDGAGDVRQVAGGRTESRGAVSVWVSGLGGTYLERGRVEGGRDASR